jgi:hypothetical protein
LRPSAAWPGTLVVNITDPSATGSTTATITIDDDAIPTYKDTGIPGPYPCVLVVGALSAEQVTTLVSNGYGYIAMDTGSVYSDYNGTTNPHTGAYNELYQYQAGVYEYDSGARRRAGTHAVSSWTTQWATDDTAVRIT